MVERRACFLGGVESYKAKIDDGALGRAAALSAQFDATVREAAKVNRIHDRQRELKRKELDVICDDLISRPPNQLSEHTSELAAKLLHRDLMARVRLT